MLGLAFAGALACAGASAAVISPGMPTTDVPDHLSTAVTLSGSQFLLPITATGAAGLQEWSFDLTFNDSIVQVVDPGDGTSGIYGAEFFAGELDTLSFILSGLPVNQQGLVDDVAGFYPSLYEGVSGDGILAWILFETIADQEGQDPGFAVPTTPPQSIPEPGTLALLVPALVLIAAARRRRAGQRADS